MEKKNSEKRKNPAKPYKFGWKEFEKIGWTDEIAQLNGIDNPKSYRNAYNNTYIFERYFYCIIQDEKDALYIVNCRFSVKFIVDMIKEIYSKVEYAIPELKVSATGDDKSLLWCETNWINLNDIIRDVHNNKDNHQNISIRDMFTIDNMPCNLLHRASDCTDTSDEDDKQHYNASCLLPVNTLSRIVECFLQEADIAGFIIQGFDITSAPDNHIFEYKPSNIKMSLHHSIEKNPYAYLYNLYILSNVNLSNTSVEGVDFNLRELLHDHDDGSQYE